MFPKELLDILACPQCKKPIRLDEENKCFICEECRVKYPITDGIPELMIEKAIQLDKE